MNKIKWGILGTGWIAHQFAKDFQHVEGAELVAVASRTEKKAQDFAQKFNILKSFSSYEAMAQDKDVDVVYIATPNIYHKEHSLLCLNNGKHILCEKPFATRLDDAQEVFDLAQANNLFCMEAMWSRFMPIMSQAKSLLEEGAIGDVKLLSASFGMVKRFDPENSLYREDMGGGCILDLGVYPLSLGLYFLGHPIDHSGYLAIGASGVDEQASMMLNFSNSAHAMLNASFNANCDNNISIYGQQGVMKIKAPMYRATQLTINEYRPAEKLLDKVVAKVKEKYLGRTVKAPIKGNGYHYQAQAVVDCIHQQQIQCKTMPWTDTLKTLHITDEIKRLSLMEQS